MRTQSFTLHLPRLLLAAALIATAVPAHADCAGLSARAAESTRALYVFLDLQREAYTTLLEAEADRNADPADEDLVQAHEAARADYAAAKDAYEQTLQKLVDIGRRLERECS